ncbi:MAG: hypothetical protein QM428_03420, partial [Verrucomicrobiota bacterium]|nr:hypothetical protein [Verrucomicrobiota bacterium]
YNNFAFSSGSEQSFAKSSISMAHFSLSTRLVARAEARLLDRNQPSEYFSTGDWFAKIIQGIAKVTANNQRQYQCITRATPVL